MPSGRSSLMRCAMLVRYACASGVSVRRSGTDHVCFLSRVRTSMPRWVEMASDEWNMLML